MAYLVRYESAIIKTGANVLLNFHGSLLWTGKVGELLFDGFEDPVLTYLIEANSSLFQFPWEKFGWFVNRNGSWSHDGVFNMNNGEVDINKLGTLPYDHFSVCNGSKITLCRAVSRYTAFMEL